LKCLFLYCKLLVTITSSIKKKNEKKGSISVAHRLTCWNGRAAKFHLGDRSTSKFVGPHSVGLSEIACYNAERALTHKLWIITLDQISDP
jgi:hypothetical protein